MVSKSARRNVKNVTETSQMIKGFCGLYLQWNDILANVKARYMPGALQSMIFLLPILSIHLSATSVKRKLVPEMINPTAVG